MRRWTVGTLFRVGVLASPLAILLSALAAPACSSDDPGSTAPDATSSSTDDGTTTTTDSSTARRDATSDAPSGPVVMCSIGGAVEVEPDDTPATATPFTALTLCGVLSSGTDVDYSTFDTPPGTKLGLFQAVVEGKVDFSISLNGKVFGPTDTAQFGSGTYLVKASTGAGQPASYNVRVQFDPN